MKQLGKSSKFEYTVEPFTEDFTGVLAWQELGKRILAAAGMHADSHGFGMKQLMPQNMAWVLSRMTISMNEMPKVNEKYAVDTWIRNIYRTFTDRCFAILRPDNTAYGYAYTTWALINMETRMPVNLENLPDGGFAKWIDDEKICQVSDNSRIRVKESEPSRVITAYYSDIDINCHVNSIRYIEHMLDLFPQEQYTGHPLANLEIAYHGEALYGDSLALYKQCVSPGVWDVEVRMQPREDETGREKKICSCRMTFK